MEAKCKCSRHVTGPAFLLGLLLSLKLWSQRSTGLERSPNPILPVSPVLFIVTLQNVRFLGTAYMAFEQECLVHRLMPSKVCALPFISSAHFCLYAFH